MRRQPGLSTPCGAALDEALAQLDYFVAIDIYLNGPPATRT